MYNGEGYYYGSYGLVRGYGPLYKTLAEADRSVREDGKVQRAHGGSTDRNAVAVDRKTGLCWWVDEEDPGEPDLLPVKTATGEQARYTIEAIRGYEWLWGTPQELAGFW